MIYWNCEISLPQYHRAWIYLELPQRIGIHQSDNWYVTFVVITIRSFPHSWLVTGFEKLRMSLVEQELPTLPELLNTPGFKWGSCCSISVYCFVDRCLFFHPFFCWPLDCLSFTLLDSPFKHENKSGRQLSILFFNSILLWHIGPFK